MFVHFMYNIFVIP